MTEENLPAPIEIPWRLASTTQPLASGEPDQTSISLFVFEPDEEDMTSNFPNERLIYLKFTVSVSPASIADAPPVTALGEGVPCFHMLLDLKVRKGDGTVGTIRPYFHSAAPIHRTMIQSGVVGVDVFEGESDAQFMGKSGSQMYESSSSHSRTTSMGAGASGFIPIPILGLASVGGSVRNTSTDISALRGVSQVVDTTQREASEERRELTSHVMKVENVLSLLNAKYIGTPHLSFSLAPQPLHLLTVDPSDPNLWFSQLLQRRSSGIEGIQEFTVVLLVPKGEDFCVNARLQRACVLDNPPGPLTYSERYLNTPDHRSRLGNYLNRTYPQGTPISELDIDITPNLIPWGGALPAPVVNFWFSNSDTVMFVVRSPAPKPDIGASNGGWGNYKDTYEVWLDTLEDEYEREVARSPLERGLLLGDQRELDTCFSFDDDDHLTVSGSSASASPLFLIPIDLSDIDLGGISATANHRRTSVREQAFEAITRWNLLENRMAIIMANQKDTSQPTLRFDDESIILLLIDRWAKLNPKDRHNISFEQAIRILHLSEIHRRLLKSAGATDLRSIAWAIKTALEDNQYYIEAVELEKFFKLRKNKGRARIDANKILEAIGKQKRFPISNKDGTEVCKAIGKALQNSTADKATTE